MFADRIKTPLLLMHGEQDHNVPFRQSMEMYYALRRLGKDVKWVAYTHGGHGMLTSTVDEVTTIPARSWAGGTSTSRPIRRRSLKRRSHRATAEP